MFLSTGVIFDPAVQTCIFNPGWTVAEGDRRRLRSVLAADVPQTTDCGAETSEELRKLSSEVHELRKLPAEIHELKALLKELLRKQQ